MSTLHAEFLPNIKTLTITTVLDTPRDQSTSLWLNNDRTKLVLEHGDQTHQIFLPAKIPGQGTQHLQLPKSGELQCINRLSAESSASSEELIVPWSAGVLGPDSEIHCKACNTVISSGKVEVWKDLPSESWAEMMDLWHCHKPAEPDQSNGDAPAKKGYAAGNRLVAQVGTGFVDVMNFLLAEEDCTGVEIKPSAENTTEPGTIHCKTCTSTLGFHDPQTQGLRLQKPSLSLSTPTTTSQTYTPSQWFSTYLLHAIDTQGVRKFVFATLPLELWIFSTNLAFSSSESPNPSQGIKVLFRKREGGGDVDALRKENLLVETLSLEWRLEALLEVCLWERNRVLPLGLRRFLDWDVAVLPKVGSG